VVPNGEELYMFYTAQQVPRAGADQIGVAMSMDGGRTWDKDSLNPVLGRGPSGSWDMNAVELGSVLFEGGQARMWFDGQKYLSQFSAALGYAAGPGPVAVTDGPEGIPASFGVAQNYPNPFNPTTTITYELPWTSEVRLSVHDMLGREVRMLVIEKKAAGSYSVILNGAGLSTGVYVYRLTARPLDFTAGRDARSGPGTFVQARTILLLR